MESGKEGFLQLVVTGCNAPEVFDLVEEALDKIAVAVEFLSIRAGKPPMRLRTGAVELADD